MDLKLKDKIALVTGTGSQIGFGRGIALMLAQEGCDVICLDKDREGAKKTAADVRATGRKAAAYGADISKKAEVDAAVTGALDEFGRIDILVNCAGLASGIRPFAESTPEQWDIDIDTNLKGTMMVTRAVLPRMIERKYGKIINFSTHAANQPTGLAGTASYVAAKAGTVMFSKNLVGELADSNINVNVVAPGPGATGFHRATGASEEMARLVDNLAKAGLATSPEDIAYTVAFLASDVARHLNGQVIEVAGTTGRTRS